MTNHYDNCPFCQSSLSKEIYFTAFIHRCINTNCSFRFKYLIDRNSNAFFYYTFFITFNKIKYKIFRKFDPNLLKIHFGSNLILSLNYNIYFDLSNLIKLEQQVKLLLTFQ